MGWMRMSSIVIYDDGKVALDAMIEGESIWLSQKQIAELFDVKVPAVSKHLKNIFKSGELDEKVVVSKMETTTRHGAITGKTQTKNINFYNLDSIISIGYRVNSKRATQFRIWATNVLKEHIVQGYTINNERLLKNYDAFLRAVEDIKLLSQNSENVRVEDVLELIKSFSATWFGLDSYDREELPKEGINKVNLEFEVEKLYQDIAILKQELIARGEAAEIFATEKTQRSLEGIFGNVFQSVFGEDAYPTVEEKAAHLLYFVVKNHPFNDGNKRCGAFSFIWLLKRAGFEVEKFINPNALTALTLLIAESNPNDKDRMVGLVLLMLRDV